MQRITHLGPECTSYRTKPGRPKKATLRWEPAAYKLSWADQKFDGPHMLISLDNEQYGVALREFFATHRALPDIPDHYMKDVVVRAMQVSEETEVVTIVDGREESRANVPPGCWVIQNPGGEVYYNTDEKFRASYEPV